MIRIFLLTWIFSSIVFFLQAQETTDTIVVPDVSVVPEESTDIIYRENKFEDISGDSSMIEVRIVPDSVVKKLQSDEAFWYANESWKKEEEVKPRSRRQPITTQQWFKTLMWIIIIGAFIGAVIWYLSASNFRFFGRKTQKVTMGDEDIETDDIFGIHYEREIAKAENNGNFRLAIRLRFLQLLKTLSEKNIIRYQQDRTNFDYLLQLSSSEYYKDFFRIVRNYEYSWYGKMDPGEAGYSIIRNEFSQLNSRLA